MATSNPPITERFRATAASWKGTKWKIIVAGIKNIRSREQASLIRSVKIKRIAPPSSKAIANTIITIETGSGNPLLVIYSAWAVKFVILPGIAFIKIALRSRRPRKFKEINFFKSIKFDWWFLQS